jgi:hypothetical protein
MASLFEDLGPPQKHLTVGAGFSKVVDVVAVPLHLFIPSKSPGSAVSHLGSLHDVVGTGLSVE